MAVLINPKHEKFAQLVAAGANKTQAAKSLGYSASRAASTGCNLAKDRNIAARIAELANRASEHAVCAAAVDRMWVLQRLRQNVERAMQLEQVVDAKGNPTGELRYEGSVANRALELLGKELGMFVDRSDHTFKWDGDPTKLDASQLTQLRLALEQMVCGGDPTKLAELRAEAKETVQ